MIGLINFGFTRDSMNKDFLLKDYNLDDKVILVTGGTGSFGTAFTQMVVSRFKPRKLIIFSRDELKQFEMAHLFPKETYPFMRYFIGDVRDYDRLEMALRDVDIVIHAAALKHVHIAEYNPYECIHTNVLGAENIVRAAFKNKVKKVIGLSTDKAVSPVNLYGASKLAAEKTFIAANNIRGEDETIFSVVRYGNVLGSRGSIIPYFKKLIREEAEALPITDKEMSRFWITLPQAVDFVLSNLAIMQGGEIFVPKIPSMKIIDIIKALAPKNVKTKVIGIRPGEKLHECMITQDESRNLLELDDRYILSSPIVEPTTYDDLNYKTCNKRFRYSSDANSDWLTEEAFLEVIKGL